MVETTPALLPLPLGARRAGADPEMLTALPLFASLSSEHRALVARLLETRHVGAGEIVVEQGGSGDALFLVVLGRLQVSLTPPGGETVTIAALGPRDSFGELAILDGQPRSATVEATEPSELLVLTREAFTGLLAKTPLMSLAVLSSLATVIRRHSAQTTDALVLDVNERAARILVELVRGADRLPGDRAVLVRARVEAEVASAVGVRDADEVLLSFQKLGIISLRGGEVLIPDVTALIAGISDPNAWQTLAARVYHDPLTGLANGVLFHERLSRAVTHACLSGSSVAVVRVALDDLADVVAEHGPETRDEILRQVGERLHAGIRHPDTAATLGGEDFAVILEDVNPEAAATAVARMIDGLSARMLIGRERLSLTASVGMALLEEGNLVDADTLLDQAERARQLAMTPASRTALRH